MLQPLIYIILVNYNGYKDTIDCVESLRKVNYSNYKIIVVDNASTNNSLTYFDQSLKDCLIIKSKINLGFAGGNNLGINYALSNGADYVMLLNNDTLVEPNFLENMISPFIKIDKVGLVGCKIMYYPQHDIVWYGGGSINWFKFIGEHHGFKETDKNQYNKEKEVDFVTGCCMLIKGEAFKKTGLLSDEYFMYFEDVDFCVRVKDVGYKIWYNPKAIIYHKVGLSGGGEESPFTIKWCTRNRLLFMKKYNKKVNRIAFFFTNMFFYTTRLIRYFQYKVNCKNDKASAILQGIREGKKFN